MSAPALVRVYISIANNAVTNPSWTLGMPIVGGGSTSTTRSASGTLTGAQLAIQVASQPPPGWTGSFSGAIVTFNAQQGGYRPGSATWSGPAAQITTESHGFDDPLPSPPPTSPPGSPPGTTPPASSNPNATNIGANVWRDVSADNQVLEYLTSSQANHQARRLQIPASYASGWLTEITSNVAGRGSSINGRLMFWEDDPDGGDVLYQSATQTWGTNQAWRRAFPSVAQAPRLESGKSYWVGYWSDITKSRQIMTSRGLPEGQGLLRASSPAQVWSGYDFEVNYTLHADFFYQQNARPDTGVWRAGSPSGTVNTPQPTFEGTLPHGADSAFDSTTKVHLQVWRTDTGVMLYDNTFDVTPSEWAQRYFSRVPALLPIGVTCKAKFRHYDTWGAVSNFSAEATFAVAEGPLPPTLTGPSGKLNIQTDFSYTGIYHSGVGRNSNAIRIRLLNEFGTQVLHDSGFESITAAPEGVFSFPAWHPALLWGTNYLYDVQFRDTSNILGPITTGSFKTNSPPQVPLEIAPGGSSNTPEKTLRASFVDPDQDTVTSAEIELFDVTNNAMVASFPKIVSVSENKLAYDASPYIVTDRTYRWRVRATDGLSTYNLLSPERRTVETDIDEGTSYYPASSISGFNSYWGAQITRDSSIKRSGAWSLKVGVDAQEHPLAWADAGPLELASETNYQWSAWVYSPVQTYIRLSQFFLGEGYGAIRSAARAGPIGTGAFPIPAATWIQISGSGRTEANWNPISRLVLRPARKADDSGFDSTKVLYFDDFLVTGGTVYGGFSDWQTFTHRQAPQVSFIAPTLTGQHNRVPKPQPDLSTPGFWTELDSLGTGRNLLSANQSSVETNTTGLLGIGSAPISRSTSFPKYGSASLKVDAPEVNAGMRVDSTTLSVVSNDTSVVSSAWVKIPVGVSFRIEGSPTDDSDVLISVGHGAQEYNGTGDFQFVATNPWSISGQNFKPSFQILLSSSVIATFYVDGLQVEEGGVATEWELGSLGVPGYIGVVEDFDSAFGEQSWRGVEGPLSVNSYESEYMGLDATRPIIAFVYAKKEPDSGTSKTRFAIKCYNNSDALLGTLYPSSISLANDTNVPASWTPYGGIVWPVGHAEAIKFPTGTTKFKIQFTPSYQSEAIVRFDGFYWDHVPLVSVADWPGVQKWWGYIDGDTDDYEPRAGWPTYAWVGASGLSESIGPHMASDAGLSLYTTYFHPSGQLKASDQLIIHRATSTGWEAVYQTPFEGGNRTIIPLPSGVIKSENRYKIVLKVRDAVGITTEMPELYFSVRYEGPPQLNINVARADNDRAEVYIGFDRTTLSLSQFGGVEIAVGDDRTVVHRELDPNVTEIVWPFPVSGVNESYWVRQVEIRGTEEVEGRWDRAEVLCEYREWWLKDIERPREIALNFIVYSQDEPHVEEAPEIMAYRPWGTPSRVPLVPEARPRDGTLVIRLLDRDPALASKLAVFEDMRSRWKTMAFLSHRPEQRQYVIVNGRERTSAHIPFYAVFDLSWQEANYKENYYEREGTVQS